MPLSPSTAIGDDAARRKSGSFDSLETHGPESAREAARRQIIAELLDTERKFVQDLEVMQVCCNSSPSNQVLTEPFCPCSELRHRA
jgi:hypothetical protein